MTQANAKNEILRTILWSFLALVIIRSFLFESFKIPSSSMVPTLQIGDHIFVSKFDYGLNIPFTKWELVSWATPNRGDIVVFLFPKDESLHYVKRVIGVPGDTIEFRGRELFINGDKANLEKVESEVAGADPEGEVFEEDLSGKKHCVRFLPPKEAGFMGMKQKEVIPPDHFFVVGDNRDQSYDSRSWGLISRENIKGRARVIWLSVKPATSLMGARQVDWKRSGQWLR